MDGSGRQSGGPASRAHRPSRRGGRCAGFTITEILISLTLLLLVLGLVLPNMLARLAGSAAEEGRRQALSALAGARADAMRDGATLLVFQGRGQDQQAFHQGFWDGSDVQEILGDPGCALGRCFHGTPAFNEPPPERHDDQRCETGLPASDRLLVE